LGAGLEQGGVGFRQVEGLAFLVNGATPSRMNSAVGRARLSLLAMIRPSSALWVVRIRSRWHCACRGCVVKPGWNRRRPRTPYPARCRDNLRQTRFGRSFQLSQPTRRQPVRRTTRQVMSATLATKLSSISLHRAPAAGGVETSTS
jgi:hypothetical protein